jgi:hypothetical protein
MNQYNNVFPQHLDIHSCKTNTDQWLTLQLITKQQSIIKRDRTTLRALALIRGYTKEYQKALYKGKDVSSEPTIKKEHI